MDDHMSGAGKVPDECGILEVRKCSKHDRTMLKEHRSQHEEAISGQIYNNLGKKINNNKNG